MERFVVPQFIDVEDKIIGPVTTRQFVLMLFPALTGAIFFKIFDFSLFLLITIPMVIAFGLLAFFKVNGMPLHFFLLNLIQSLRKPALRVWDKNLRDDEIRARIKVEEVTPSPPPPRKAPISRSRLHELTLVVNTGGVYQPDEE
jgi:hypothetical protein